MKYFSTFSGVGGFEIGIQNAYAKNWRMENKEGSDLCMERTRSEEGNGTGESDLRPKRDSGFPDSQSPSCIGFSEIDKYASAVLKYRFPNTPNYGDIEKINWSEIPDFDLLVGGSPCQDFSVAGKRKGIGGARSGLFFEYVRALKQKRPDFFIWENVKGVLSINRGFDFAAILSEFSEAGYSLWWQVLNAKDFGVPQNRERIFVVGSRNTSAREVFFERQNDKIHSIQDETDGRWPQAEVCGTLKGSNMKADNTFVIHNIYGGFKEKTVREFHDFSPTLRTPKGGGHIPNLTNGKTIRRFTPTECERLMSWPDDWTKYGIDEQGKKMEIPDGQRYKLCGNGVVSRVVAEVVKAHLST